MEDEKQEMTVVANELIWAYFAAGIFVLAILLRFVWQREGLMSDELAWERWRLVGAAVVFGFGLGWLLYPRRIRFPRGD